MKKNNIKENNIKKIYNYKYKKYITYTKYDEEYYKDYDKEVLINMLIKQLKKENKYEVNDIFKKKYYDLKMNGNKKLKDFMTMIELNKKITNEDINYIIEKYSNKIKFKKNINVLVEIDYEGNIDLYNDKIDKQNKILNNIVYIMMIKNNLLNYDIYKFFPDDDYNDEFINKHNNIFKSYPNITQKEKEDFINDLKIKEYVETHTKEILYDFILNKINKDILEFIIKYVYDKYCYLDNIDILSDITKNIYNEFINKELSVKRFVNNLIYNLREVKFSFNLDVNIVDDMDYYNNKYKYSDILKHTKSLRIRLVSFIKTYMKINVINQLN